MKKLFALIGIAVILALIASCENTPTFGGSIPPDPAGSEPMSWGEDVKMNVTIDKSLQLTPIAMPEYTKIKVSFLGYTPPEDTSADNFMVFEDGKKQGFILEKYTEVSKKVDIVFVVDVTGSMREEIAGVKNSLKSFIDYLLDSGLDVKVAVVPFGDYVPPRDDTTDSVEFDPLWLNLSDLSSAKDYVDRLRTGFGGDYPENSYGAIMYAWKNVSWRAGAQRVFILLTDAFSHYRGDDDWWDSMNDFDPKYTKDEVLSALIGYTTLYIVASTGGYYSESDEDFSNPADPREIAIKTGGFVIYQSGGEEVDLSEIGIAEAINSTFIITFESDSPVGTHTISVYYEGSDGKQGHANVQMSY